MKKILFICFILLFASNSFAAWTLRPATEFNQRQGLPNFFKKATAGDSVKVGFIGGSITEAVGWRNNIMNWFKARYKNNKIVQKSAAIGGTNSLYGVFRIEKDLFALSKYDLIFIEFSVNDEPGTSADVEKSIEGLIRKIWKLNPSTDICMIYTVAASHFPAIDAGTMNLTATKHDSIASYYKIPSVFMGLDTRSAIKADTVSWYTPITDTKTGKDALGKYVFTADNTHPTAFGHNFYTNIISRSMVKMETVKSVFSHTIPTSIVPANYENAHMIPVSKTQNNGMTWVDKSGIYSFMNSYVTSLPHENYVCSENPNSSYSFNFNGTKIGLAIIVGQSVGKFNIEIDNVSYPLTAFDPYCYYYRKQYKTIDVAPGNHTFKVYPTIDTLTIAQKTALLKTTTDIIANPANYCFNNLIFSHIMIDGTIGTSTAEVTIKDETSNYVCFSKNRQIVLQSKTVQEANSEVCVYDVNGRLVFRKAFTDKEIRTGILPQGFYTLQVIENSKRVCFKVVIS